MQVVLRALAAATVEACIMKKWMVIVIPVVFVSWCALAYTLPVYHYESSDRVWSELEVPWKGRHFETVERSFADHRRAYPNAVLHRTSSRVWYAPNLWWDNVTHRRWGLPYAEPASMRTSKAHINDAVGRTGGEDG